MNFAFGIAGAEDDAAIRRLLVQNPMPGAVEVSFEREPEYFRGHGVMGDRCLTIKATDTAENTLAGIICIAASERFIHKVKTPVGYMGQLRIDHRYRGYMLPLRAVSFVKQLAGADWPEIWFTAFVDENPEAVGIFAAHPRPSLPKMRLVSRITTLGISVRGRYQRYYSPQTGCSPGYRGEPNPRVANPALQIVQGDLVGIEPIVGFLRRHGKRREFFPAYLNEDFTEEIRTPGFEVADFLVCVRNGAIVGVCGVWDQSSFKQTVVRGYRGTLARVRPMLNLMSPLIGMQKLPPVGAAIRSAYLSFVAVEDNESAVFLRLLRAAVALAYRKGKEYLFAGFCDEDPLLKVARTFRHVTYRSGMYAFSLLDSETFPSLESESIPYVEIGAL